MYLQVKDVKKSYGRDTSYVQVLKGISTGLERGQMCVIQGTSGSGKSTLLNCIGGLDTMDSGSITVDGKEIFGLKPAQLSLVKTMIAAGTVIFCVVMYLMMGVMIDRSAAGISLIKIFGYRPKEIRALYLNGNLLVVAAGALIAVPLAKFLMDAIYPSFIRNVACSMKLAFPWYLYAVIYAAVILVYFVINRLLIGKINRISPAEVLKNRE